MGTGQSLTEAAMNTFDIISDSPYRSKRTPITGEQVRESIPPTKVGRKRTIRPVKKMAERKGPETVQEKEASEK
jgi:hypothetical protein